MLKAFKEKRAEKKAAKAHEARKQKVLAECGNVCYCPECNDILNDQADCHEGAHIVRYRCKTCGRVSKWNFGVAPVPFLIK